MITQQGLPLADLAIEQLHGSRRFLLALVETLSDDQLTARVGGVGNHAIWVMGHLAFAEDLFVSEFLQEPSRLPNEHAEHFRAGTTHSTCATMSSAPEQTRAKPCCSNRGSAFA